MSVYQSDAINLLIQIENKTDSFKEVVNFMIWSGNNCKNIIQFGYKYLTKKLKMGERTIREHIKTMKENGWLFTRRRARKTNVYILNEEILKCKPKQAKEQLKSLLRKELFSNNSYADCRSSADHVLVGEDDHTLYTSLNNHNKCTQAPPGTSKRKENIEIPFELRQIVQIEEWQKKRIAKKFTTHIISLALRSANDYFIKNPSFAKSLKKPLQRFAYLWSQCEYHLKIYNERKSKG